ncbi:hypothetical protein K461DRAFT_221899 [Myriangium duriaei CBS 260.36]|uniref:RRM domain-containing protein n=1 Tax=Myriangium duriaei CBS 260.36 TaxID=1168546 RepID=A0A9P4J4R1_9PEZI|nr:hypothetical protein K461DRAFT_221899 [Myriangium duriaei CBS 260.36]
MPKKEFVNTSIYITGLPLDATFTEVHDFFKKFGLIQENIDSETPRIKMYTDENGTFKGEALVTYFRPESVTQAINLADESDFRGFGSGNMRITEADSSYKKVKEYEAVDGGDTKKVQKRRKDVEKIKRATEKMNAKLADWSDDDEYEKPAEKGKPNKFANSVIVRNMFTGDILEEEKEAREQAIANGETPEPSILIDIVDDIKDMAKEQQWGNIKTIDVFDLEPDGVIIITFTNPVDAEKGLRNLDGRFYDQRQLSAEIQTKRARFRKTKEDESDEERRLQQYGEELTKGLA